MKTTLPESRREFWKYHSAAIAFQSAAQLALTLHSMNEADKLFYDLNLAMHVVYSRPFKHQEKTLQLSSDLVPQSLLQYHNGLLYCRDKAYAHHDRKTMKIRNEDGDEFASLVITVQGGELHARQAFPYFHPDELPKVAEVCEMLLSICTAKLSVLAEECLDSGSVLADGVYTVSSRFEGEVPLLKRIK
jgi:hypothetical protein